MTRLCWIEHASACRNGRVLPMASYRLSPELPPNLVMHSARQRCETRAMAELDGAPVTAEALQSLGLVNYGHFTSMRVDNQGIRGLSQHLDRLVHDCRVIFSSHLGRAPLRGLIRHAIADEPGSVFGRVTVFDPDLRLA